jgi:hypothetical protein
MYWFYIFTYRVMKRLRKTLFKILYYLFPIRTYNFIHNKHLTYDQLGMFWIEDLYGWEIYWE